MANTALVKEHGSFQKMVASTLEAASSFEEFTKCMCSREVLGTTHRFLHVLKRVRGLDCNPRHLLTAYLMRAYPTETLSSERNDLEETVYQRACCVTAALVHAEAHGTWCEEAFMTAWNGYVDDFQTWQKQDREDLLQVLAKTHKQVRNWEDIAESKGTLEKLEGMARGLGGEDAVHHVQTSSEWGLVDPTTMAIQLTEQMHKAFWDRFTQELAEEPPNLVQYPKLVGEIRERLLRLLGSREKAVVWLKQHLHAEEISVRIQKGAYDLQEVYNVCVFCLERVKELGAAADDARVDLYLERLHREMEADVPAVHQIIPNVFKFCLESLDSIGFIKDSIFDLGNNGE